MANSQMDSSSQTPRGGGSGKWPSVLVEVGDIESNVHDPESGVYDIYCKLVLLMENEI